MVSLAALLVLSQQLLDGLGHQSPRVAVKIFRALAESIGQLLSDPDVELDVRGPSMPTGGVYFCH